MRGRKSKKDSQYNGQKEKVKSATTIYRTLHRKLKIMYFRLQCHFNDGFLSFFPQNGLTLEICL